MRPIILFCVAGLLRKRRVLAHKWPPKAFCLITVIPRLARAWPPRLHATEAGISDVAGRYMVPSQRSLY